MKARTRQTRGRKNRLLGRCHQVQMMRESQSDTYISISFLFSSFPCFSKVCVSSTLFIITLMYSTNIIHYKYSLKLLNSKRYYNTFRRPSSGSSSSPRSSLPSGVHPQTIPPHPYSYSPTKPPISSPREHLPPCPNSSLC